MVSNCTLYIGPKNYSSWSLRPWLALRWAGIDFEESLIALDQPGYGEQQIRDVLAVSPNGTVPALHVGHDVIWDSLAIAEWAAERTPGLWPKDAVARSMARSVTSEMHSGFSALRKDLPMNILRRCAAQPWRQQTRMNISRIEHIWGECRERFGAQGPWLFGDRSIADAFFAPVVTRFRTYSVELSAVSTAYCETVLSDSDYQLWELGCIGDSWDSPGYPIIDGLYRELPMAQRPPLTPMGEP
jgi:glutathione S-transferase